MTIKTQGGKIITKNQKISCECCDGGCCKYPAGLLASGAYNASQLPTSINFYGISLPRQGSSYGTSENGIFLEGAIWAAYRNGVRSTREFLVCEFGPIQDDFLDVYRAIVPFGNGGSSSALIYRQNNWLWEGTQSCGKFVRLIYYYCADFVMLPNKNDNIPIWNLVWQECFVPEGGQPGDQVNRVGDPVGIYSNFLGAQIQIP